MSTDLETRNLIVPLTGQIVSLDSEDVQLASLVDELRSAKGQINDVIRIANAELVSRLDRSAKWTRSLPGGYTISAPSPEPSTEYDAEPLYWALQQLADEGAIDREAAEGAVEQTVDYKAKAAGIKRLAKVSPALRDLVAQHSHSVEKSRSVSVKRS